MFYKCCSKRLADKDSKIQSRVARTYCAALYRAANRYSEVTSLVEDSLGSGLSSSKGKFGLVLNAPLSGLSGMRCGGAVEKMTIGTTVQEIREALRYAGKLHSKWIVVGLGSNTLFLDNVFKGLIIVNRVRHLGLASNSCIHLPLLRPAELGTKKCRIKVGSGNSLQHLSHLTTRMGWGGLEFAIGIPGTVGGAIKCNAGAHGQELQEMKDVLKEVSILDPNTLDVRPHDVQALDWNYRNVELPCSKGVITSATFSLTADPFAHSRALNYIAKRKISQPVGVPSLGCIFKNTSNGESAGWLIEKAGLKGYAIGGASISTVHANFFVNSKQSATPEDVMQLIQHAQQVVREQYSIDLALEIVVVTESQLLH